MHFRMLPAASRRAVTRTAAETVQENPNPVSISFSGIDGAGKSTQIHRLCGRLNEIGLQV